MRSVYKNQMRVKILTLRLIYSLILGFIFITASPVFAEDFSLTKDFTLKKSSNTDIAFGLLQYSAWILINMDMVFTSRTISRYGLKAETNPFWRSIWDKPALVFATVMVINIGICWGTTKLYKKNKFLAYLVIALVNIVQIYYVNTHLNLWRKR